MKTVYIFVNKDLSPAQQSVQSCHAILEAKIQYDNHPYIILFGIRDKKMRKVLHDLSTIGIKCIPFYEPDLDNKLTAFCTYPMDRHEYMKKFQLLKHENIK